MTLRRQLALTALLLAAASAGAQTPPTAPAAPQEPALAPSSGAIITPATPVPAATQGTAQQMDQAFARADRDRSGGLSRAEAEAYSAVRLNFEELDANKDGVLSRAEFERAVR